MNKCINWCAYFFNFGLNVSAAVGGLRFWHICNLMFAAPGNRECLSSSSHLHAKTTDVHRFVAARIKNRGMSQLKSITAVSGGIHFLMNVSVIGSHFNLYRQCQLEFIFLIRNARSGHWAPLKDARAYIPRWVYGSSGST